MTAESIPRRFPFAQAYQEALIGLMVGSMEGLSLIPVVRPEFFELPVHRAIVRAVGALTTRLRTGITWRLLRSEVRATLPLGMARDALRVCRKLETQTLSSAERRYVLEEAGKFCKLQAMGNALIASVDLYRAQNLDGLDRLWRRSLETGRTLVDDGFDLFASAEARHQALVRQTGTGRPIRTMIPGLDRQFLFGGAVPPTLNVLVALPGFGKTMFGIHVSAAGVLQGKRVCYITNDMAAEQVAMRFDARFAKVRLADVILKWPTVKRRLAAMQRRWGDALRLKYFPPGEGSVADIDHYLGLLDARGFTTDLLVIDYADQLAPPRGTRATGASERYHELGDVYTELQRLMNRRQLVIWTLSQAVRGALAKPLIMIDDIAESMKKIMIADMVLTFNQTPDERANQRARLFVAKNRMAPSYAVVPIRTDYARGRFAVPDASLAQPYRLRQALGTGPLGPVAGRPRKIGT